MRLRLRLGLGLVGREDSEGAAGGVAAAAGVRVTDALCAVQEVELRLEAGTVDREGSLLEEVLVEDLNLGEVLRRRGVCVVVRYTARLVDDIRPLLRTVDTLVEGVARLQRGLTNDRFVYRRAQTS